ETLAGLGIATRLDCLPGHWLAADTGNESMIELCTSREGNWPQIVVTAPVGKILYQAEGLPVLVPVFAAAISQQSGETVGLGDAASSLDQLEAVLGGHLPVFRARDLSAYNELIPAARYYHNSRNPAAPETAHPPAPHIPEPVLRPTPPRPRHPGPDLRAARARRRRDAGGARARGQQPRPFRGGAEPLPARRADSRPLAQRAGAGEAALVPGARCRQSRALQGGARLRA